MNDSPLHPSILALVSLAAQIAAKHPKQGQCQLDRLRSAGVASAHIDAVIDIARHIRDEAGAAYDQRFDEIRDDAPTAPAVSAACCTPTASGQACC